MGDLAGDRESAIELIIRDSAQLRAIAPEHPLLKYICNVTEQGFELAQDEAVQRDFFDKYARDRHGNKKTEIPVAVLLANYYVDIDKALEAYK